MAPTTQVLGRRFHHRQSGLVIQYLFGTAMWAPANLEDSLVFQGHRAYAHVCLHFALQQLYGNYAPFVVESKP